MSPGSCLSMLKTHDKSPAHALWRMAFCWSAARGACDAGFILIHPGAELGVPVSRYMLYGVA